MCCVRNSQGVLWETKSKVLYASQNIPCTLREHRPLHFGAMFVQENCFECKQEAMQRDLVIDSPIHKPNSFLRCARDYGDILQRH